MVFLGNGTVFAVLDKVIDIAKACPCPSRAGYRAECIGRKSRIHAVAGYEVGIVVYLEYSVVGSREQFVKRVGVQFQSAFRLKDGLPGCGSLRHFVQVAAGDACQQQGAGYDVLNMLIHNRSVNDSLKTYR